MIAMRTAALTAALACVALVAATSAMASQFRAERYEAPVSGSLVIPQEGKTQVMTLGGSSLSCRTSSLTGPLAAPSSSLSLTPSYEKCVWSGVSATVSVNSCKFVLNSTNESAPLTGTLGVNCSKPGDSIVVNSPGLPCTVTIPQQAAHGQVQFENLGVNQSRIILTKLSVAGLSHTIAGVGCTKQGAFENGALSGTYTFSSTAFGGSEPNGFYIGKEQTGPAIAKLNGENYPAFYKSLGGLEGTKALAYLGANSAFESYWSGSISGPAEDLNMTVGLFQAKKSAIKANGCHFVFHIVSKETGTAGVSCETPGAKMVIEHLNQGGCVSEIPAQYGLKGVSFKNIGSGSGRSVEVDVYLNGVTYTGVGSACDRRGTFSNGVISTHMTLQGHWTEPDGILQGIWNQ